MAEATKRRMRRIETDFVKLENEGDSVSGILMAKDSAEFPRGVVGKYQFAQDGGPPKTILGSTELDDKLALVDIGTYVEITLTGKTATRSGQQMKNFLVEVEE